MTFYVPPNQSVSWSIYWQTVQEQTRLPWDFLKSRMAQVLKSFDRGEPIWMVVDELKWIYRERPKWKL